MDINGTQTHLCEDEAMIFDGSQPHIYKNDGDVMVKMTMVMYYSK